MVIYKGLNQSNPKAIIADNIWGMNSLGVKLKLVARAERDKHSSLKLKREADLVGHHHRST